MDEKGTANQADEASPARVASIVNHRSEAFVLLLQLADRHFADPEFKVALARSLRESPALIELWQAYSWDQRWTPSAYVEGTEVGWIWGMKSTNVRIHPDQGAAVADFIQRSAAWLARRQVVEVET